MTLYALVWVNYEGKPMVYSKLFTESEKAKAFELAAGWGMTVKTVFV